MRFRVGDTVVSRGLIGVSLLVAALAGFASPAHALTYGGSPEEICTGDLTSNEIILSTTLAPSEGSTVQSGVPVTFSGVSGSPLSFSVASSPALLSTPDIDSGPGVAQPPLPPKELPTYTFISTKATAIPRTIYWTASYPESGIQACASLSPAPTAINTTPVHTLTVLPAPIPPVHVSIQDVGKLHLSHATVSYQVHCTVSCSGETSYQISVLRRHKTVQLPKLDPNSVPVSISAGSGGDQRVGHRYSVRSLRMLDGILRTGDAVKVQITVKVIDKAGNTSQAHSTVRLRG